MYVEDSFDEEVTFDLWEGFETVLDLGEWGRYIFFYVGGGAFDFFLVEVSREHDSLIYFSLDLSLLSN